VNGKPLRVALVAEDYYPQVGGVPEHTHHLAKQLHARGHVAHIYTSHMREPWVDDPFVHRVGTSRIITANAGVSRITTGWGLLGQLTRRFREDRYDIVHVQGGLAPTFGVLAPIAARRLGIPVVATFHSWFPRSAGYRILRRPFKWLLDHHAANIAVSEPVVSAMSRYFDVDWEVIPNGVSTSFFHPNHRVPADPSHLSPRLLFLARLEQRNALGTVLRAMPRILERYPTAELVVVGDGPQRRQFEAEARPLGDRVRFTGEVLRERPDYYASADLFLCPTTRASFGVTLIESMACGTPLIASDIIGFREVIAGGEEAVLVPPDDPEAWAKATIDLLADPPRRIRMRQAALAKAKLFDWSVVSERIVAVYRRVLAQPKRVA
jgi:phosphatidylinositol alpha-mannosyltransferase